MFQRPRCNKSRGQIGFNSYLKAEHGKIYSISPICMMVRSMSDYKYTTKIIMSYKKILQITVPLPSKII